jgi:hypothetical protein
MLQISELLFGNLFCVSGEYLTKYDSFLEVRTFYILKIRSEVLFFRKCFFAIITVLSFIIFLGIYLGLKCWKTFGVGLPVSSHVILRSILRVFVNFFRHRDDKRRDGFLCRIV